MAVLAIIIKIIAFISYGTLALLTGKSNTEIRVRQFFFIYLASMILWQFTSLIITSCKSPNIAIFWYNLQFSSGGLQSILFFPLTRAFLRIKKQRIWAYSSYLTSLFLIVISVLGFAVKEVYIGKAGYYIPEFTNTVYIMVFVMYFYWGFGVFNLIRGLQREKSPLQRNRIRYPLLGAIMVMAGAASNFTNLQDYPVDSICNLINAILIGYAVIRYRLLDIRIALKRSLLYLVSLLCLIGIYVVSMFALQSVFQDRFRYSSFWAGIIALLVVISLFLVIVRRKTIQMFFTSLLFKEKITYQKALEEFTRKAGATLDFDILMNLFVSTVLETVKLNFAGLMLLDNDRREYSIRKRLFLDSITPRDFTIEKNNELVLWVMNSGKPLWKEEMKIDPLYSNLLPECDRIFADDYISLIVPIIHKQNPMGLLVIGEKTNGDLYTDDDLRFLTTISNITATAFANSLSYNEVERQLSEQTLLFVLSKTFGRSGRLDIVMDSILKILIYFLNLDYCVIVSFTGESGVTSYFSSGLSGEAKNEIETLTRKITKKPGLITHDETGLLLDMEHIETTNPSKTPDGLLKDSHIMRSSLNAILEQDKKPLGLIVMSNWLGDLENTQRLDTLRTIIAIISQGLLMHQTFSDLANMKSYNENIIESINTMGDMLIVFGFDGRIQSVNRATCGRLGYRESELVGNDIGKITDQKIIIINRLKNRRSIINYETTFVANDGTSVFVLFSGSIMADSETKTEQIVAMARDITDIKETEEKYRTLFEEVKDIVFSCKTDGSFLYINPAGVELFEFPSMESLLQANLRNDLFSDESIYSRFSDELLKNGFIRNFELSLKNYQGIEINVIVSANVIRDPSGRITAYRGIMKDVTEQRQLQQQLIQAQKMESIGTLAGGVAHDFNNIMCAILGYASIMKMNMETEHPFFNYLNTIESSANRAAQLTNQLLAFARAGKHNVKVLDINTIVNETVNLIKETFNRSIKIECDLAEGPPLIEGDANQIQQIVMNLCVNARDAMPDGGTLTIRTDAASISQEYVDSHLGSKTGDYVQLTVTDTGIGIDESIIRRIFDPFFTTKGPGEGTGLGLSVVYGVVKNHGGYIDARSTAGKGTAFDIFFPVVTGVRIEEEKKTEEAPTGKGELILVIDDEETVRGLTRDILEKNGYRTLLAHDGEEGVALFRAHHREIALVIIDMIMPKLGGLETFKLIRETSPHAKTVLSTGYDHSEKIQEMLDSGVMDFIKKPYKVNELLLQIRHVLDSE
ncbi:MAG: PAS domain S-box protein [Spirochaetes bacterium]|nr:PAS domain S-box protein [Spirochaetota bacterium]